MTDSGSSQLVCMILEREITSWINPHGSTCRPRIQLRTLLQWGDCVNRCTAVPPAVRLQQLKQTSAYCTKCVVLQNVCILAVHLWSDHLKILFMVWAKEKEEEAVMDERKTTSSHTTWVKSPLLMFVATVQIQLAIKMLYTDFTIVGKNEKFKNKCKNDVYLMIV